MPDPDLHALVLADARLLGGAEFVDEVRDDAIAVADQLAPRNADGTAPPQRASAWIGAAWALVDARRAERVGELVSTPSGGAQVITPARCPNGHPLRPGRVLVGWSPCRCGGHRTWECVERRADGTECRGTVLAPVPGEGCRRVGIG